MEQISKYFNAEKSESLLFILVGVAAILLSAYFFVKVKEPFYNGMAYSLIAIALIQLTVGGSVYFRSPHDIIRVNQIVQTEVSKIQTEEIPRMETVMKNFVLYRWVEIACVIVGLFMFFYCEPMTLSKGIGLGLAIQAIFMLLLDYFAENRGKVYLDYLQNIN
jgi:multidrug transporter EmrE-like cation transporter